MKIESIASKIDGITSMVQACPLCEMWQIDYAFEAMTQWPTYNDFVEALNDVIEEHFTTCLRVLVRS